MRNRKNTGADGSIIFRFPTVRTAVFLACVVMLAAEPAPVYAQLEEVIVSAQKRQESMQDVPVAVSAITSDQLADIGFNDISDIVAQVPSLSVATNISPFSTTFRVRNIGNAGNIPTFEPSTGLFIDGAFRSRSGIGIGDLVDVSSVEILKGPQSTLHGKNVTAGVISVNTMAPGREFEGMAEINLGEDNLQQFKGYVSGPLSTWLAARLSVVNTRRDGLIDNVIDEDSDSQGSYALRGQLLADLSEVLSARLIVGYGEKDMNTMTGDVFLSDANRRIITNAGGSVSIPNDATDRQVEYADPLNFTSQSNDVILTLNYDAGSYTLTAVSSYDDYDSLNKIYDAEQASLRILDYNDRQAGRSFSQELRFASVDSGSFNWLFGAFYYRNTFTRGDRQATEFILQDQVEVYGDAVADEIASAGVLPVGLLPVTVPLLGVAGDSGDYYVRQNTDSLGLFGKLDFELTENWQLAAGLRYSSEDKSATVVQTTQLSALGCVPPLNTNLICAITPDGNDFDQSDSFSAVTGSISSSYHFGDDTMGYITLSTGFKAGGYSLQNGSATDEARPFDEEKVRNVELGIKTEFWQQRARINAAVFHTEYEDFQSASFASLVFVVNNADLITVDGVELDTTFILSESLFATLNLAYVESIYDTYTAGQCYYGRTPDNSLGQCDLSGQQLPTAPRFKGNVALNWQHPLAAGDLYSRLDYLYTGSVNLTASLDPQYEQAATEMVNLRFGWRSAGMDVSLWGQNIFNEVVVSQLAPANIHTAIDNAVDSPVDSYQVYSLEPRSLGITTRFLF